MHIVHLAVAVDAISSVLMDLVELGHTTLKSLWDNYRQWCDDGGPYRETCLNHPSSHAAGIPDRASHKFFTLEVLRPAGGSKYVEVSQKVCSATATRYMIFWTRSMMDHVKATDAMAPRFVYKFQKLMRVYYIVEFMICDIDLQGTAWVSWLRSRRWSR